MIAVVVFSVSSSFFRLTQVNSVLFWERREEKKKQLEDAKEREGLWRRTGEQKRGTQPFTDVHSTVQCGTVFKG